MESLHLLRDLGGNPRRSHHEAGRSDLLALSARIAQGLLACAALLLQTACSGLALRPSSDCLPSFPYAEGWLGGDSAYSIALGDGRTLWLFGDSFIGRPDQSDRRGSTFVHNSIAISRCSAEGGFEIDYAWGEAQDGAPRAFLERDGEGWWWLFDGFVHEGRLYLGLLEVERSPPHGALQLPFRFTGLQLARIPNPEDPVERWRIEEVALSTRNSVFPASAMVVHAGYAYLFTFSRGKDGRWPRGLARLPLSALDGRTGSLASELQYLARDGSWQSDPDSGQHRVLMFDRATEMSVSFHPTMGKWLAVYSYPEIDGAFPATRASEEVWFRTSPALEGPWTEAALLYRVPELATDADSDVNTGCYAAKEHPQFSTQRLTLTYVCNLFTGKGQDPNEILRRLLIDMDLYRPVTVRIDLPRALRDLRHSGPR